MKTLLQVQRCITVESRDDIPASLFWRGLAVRDPVDDVVDQQLCQTVYEGDFIQ